MAYLVRDPKGNPKAVLYVSPEELEAIRSFGTASRLTGSNPLLFCGVPVRVAVHAEAPPPGAEVMRMESPGLRERFCGFALRLLDWLILRLRVRA